MSNKGYSDDEHEAGRRFHRNQQGIAKRRLSQRQLADLSAELDEDIDQDASTIIVSDFKGERRTLRE